MKKVSMRGFAFSATTRIIALKKGKWFAKLIKHTKMGKHEKQKVRKFRSGRRANDIEMKLRNGVWFVHLGKRFTMKPWSIEPTARPQFWDWGRSGAGSVRSRATFVDHRPPSRPPTSPRSAEAALWKPHPMLSLRQSRPLTQYLQPTWAEIFVNLKQNRQS